jgi:hypothetical protein
MKNPWVVKSVLRLFSFDETLGCHPYSFVGREEGWKYALPSIINTTVHLRIK